LNLLETPSHGKLEIQIARNSKPQQSSNSSELQAMDKYQKAWNSKPLLNRIGLELQAMANKKWNLMLNSNG
jgi:hypothetical protein